MFWPAAGRAGRQQRPPGRPHAARPPRAGPPARAPVRVRARAPRRLRARARPRAIDADEFEAHARAGLRPPARRPGSARAERAAAAAYGGDFLADEPYAEWALAERERLRDLAAAGAARAGGAQARGRRPRRRREHLQRLADLEPLDLEAQRELIGSCSGRGRHSEAFRRYELVRRRYRRAFGEEPGFSLGEVAARCRTAVERHPRRRALGSVARAGRGPCPRFVAGVGSVGLPRRTAEPAAAAPHRPVDLAGLRAADPRRRGAGRRADGARRRGDLWAAPRGLGLCGLAAFYRALSIGSMSIVAPLSATGVVIPVLGGIAVGGAPERDPGRRHRPRRVRGGAGGARGAAERPGGAARRSALDRARARRRGGVRVLLRRHRSRGADRRRRVGAADGAAPRRRDPHGLVLVRRPVVSREPRLLGPLLVVGVFDLLANLTFTIATGRGLLSVVGVLGSLYPAVTVVLARVLLHERPTPIQERRRGGHAGRRDRARGGQSAAGARFRGLLSPTWCDASSSPSSPRRCSRRRPRRPPPTRRCPSRRRPLLDDFAREQTLDEIQSLGVTHVRALVYWSEFSAKENSKSKPTFDTADPNAYPADTWGRLDHLVDSLARRGMTAQLTLTGPVPKWATKKRKDKVSDPGAKLFGKWVRAVVTRYGDRIDLWSIWNEPNHPDFLGPQYKSGKPHTPKLYRKLYVAGEAAIHGVAGNAKDKVLFGETAPIGNQNVVSPLAFLRGALCLDKNYKAKGSCKKLRIDGYAHHAYQPVHLPGQVHHDQVEVGDPDRRRRRDLVQVELPQPDAEVGVGHQLAGARGHDDHVTEGAQGEDLPRHMAAPRRHPVGAGLRRDGDQIVQRAGGPDHQAGFGAYRGNRIGTAAHRSLAERRIERDRVVGVGHPLVLGGPAQWCVRCGPNLRRGAGGQRRLGDDIRVPLGGRTIPRPGHQVRSRCTSGPGWPCLDRYRTSPVTSRQPSLSSARNSLR